MRFLSVFIGVHLRFQGPERSRGRCGVRKDGSNLRRAPNGGEGDEEGRAVGEVGVTSDGAAMGLDVLARDGEAEAAALAPRAAEWVEETLHQLVRDPMSRIRDLDHYLSSRRFAGRECQVTALTLGHRFGRILDQIAQSG